MIDKRKFNLSIKITLIIVFILILLFLVQKVFSSFQIDSEGKIISDIAFYTLEADKQSENLKMFEIVPDGKDYIYNIDVYNYKDDLVSEVDLEYDFTLVTTTNLPIDYEIYYGDSLDNIITSKEIFQDEDGMYFFKFKTSKKNFTHGVSRKDSYKLVLNFPLEYKNYKYQGLMEGMTIYINSRQV